MTGKSGDDGGTWIQGASSKYSYNKMPIATNTIGTARISHGVIPAEGIVGAGVVARGALVGVFCA